MEELIVLVQGIVLGFAIAAPVGPIGLLCIRRTIQHGPLMGFFTGFGAAIADTIYGAIAAFGVSTALSFLRGHETAFQLVGGIFLLVVAVRTFRQRPEDEEREVEPVVDSKTWIGGFMTGLSLTLTNPATIMAFIAIFAGFGLGGTLSRIEASTLVLGVFLGASLWWFTLSMGVAAVRHRISDRGLVMLNHCTGVALACFGLWALGLAVTGMVSMAME
ncbi:LysE family translocator [Azospirillum thermophilum]|uniref:Lysine transporter LysE n=1 Tax=Azospirillum thermophilum TaxID=2202148 RepID=A0A2S2CZX9_9PROT|nr:LysE family transporter [Azospirillum thermophilum]AWK89995.1 lysine transporter LysE [Azospirillum thermophilum]